MSVARKVARVLRAFGARLTRAENAAERTELAAARIERSVEIIRRAVVEQGKTLGEGMEHWRADASTRAEQAQAQGVTLLEHEQRISRLEVVRTANGAE